MMDTCNICWGIKDDNNICWKCKGTGFVYYEDERQPFTVPKTKISTPTRKKTPKPTKTKPKSPQKEAEKKDETFGVSLLIAIFYAIIVGNQAQKSLEQIMGEALVVFVVSLVALWLLGHIFKIVADMLKFLFQIAMWGVGLFFVAHVLGLMGS